MGATSPTPLDRDPVDDRLAHVVVATLSIMAFVVLMYVGRGRTFFYDEWDWVQHRSSGGVRTLLEPHNEHISVAPALLYRALFETVGLSPVWPFRALAAGAHVLAAVLLYRLARRRVGSVGALIATALFLGLGAAWQATLFGFAVNLILALGGGLLAWDGLDRRTSHGDVAACIGALLSLASSSVGIPIAIGVAVEVALTGPWRRLWVALVPLGSYAVWYVAFGASDLTVDGLANAPHWAIDAAASSAGGLVGRGLEWGRPLLVVASVAAGVAVVRGGWTPRLAGLVVTGALFWLLTGAARSVGDRVESPDASRYIEIGALLILLIAVELARSSRLPHGAYAVIAIGVAVCLLQGFQTLRAGGRDLRRNSEVVSAQLAALEIVRAHAPDDFRPSPEAAPQIAAGSYFAAIDEIGESLIGDPSRAIREAPEAERALADLLLISFGVSVEDGTTASGSDRCDDVPGAVELLLSPGEGLAIVADGGAVEVRARRFATTFVDPPVHLVPVHESAHVRTTVDGAEVPWALQATSDAPFTICPD